MDRYELVILFLQFAVMTLVGLAGGQLIHRLKQPAVLGELIAGVLIGPTVLGAVAPRYYSWLFPANRAIDLSRESIISVGMLFFLFVAGLEINLTNVHKQRKQVALTSLFGLLVPMISGIAAVWLFPRIWGDQSLKNEGAFGLVIGTALSITALPVIARILMDLDLIQKDIGVLVMTAASLDDVIGCTLFAILLNAFLPANAGKVLGGHEILGNLILIVGFAAVTLLAGRWLGRPALHWIKKHLSWPASFISLTAVAMLGAAAFTEFLGIHAVLGAYLVGIALGQSLESGEARDAHDITYQFAMSFFAPLYFVSIGLRANFATNFDLPLVLLVLIVACVGKIGGAGLGARLGGMNLRESVAVGFGMNARGAMEIILASVALEAGLIDKRVFVALVIMALITSMLVGPVMKRLVQKNIYHTAAHR
jgi:Kef-type K+ transport system membrane component KefB